MALLVTLAILTGILTAYTIRRTTRSSELRAITRKIHADLLEFRLFFDEPRLILQAWMNLLRDNLRLLVLFLPAMLILAMPMGWLMLQLQSAYGHRQLRPGEGAVVTVQFKRPLKESDRLDLRSPTGVRVETPQVRILHDNQIVWRIRATRDGGTDGKFSVAPDPDVAWVRVEYPKSDSDESLLWLAWFLAVSSAVAWISGRVLQGR